MSATQKTLVNGVFTATADTPINVYTSPATGDGTMITAFTVGNGTSLNATYKTWVVPSGSSVGDEFLLVPERTIKTGAPTDVPYEVVGHFMPVSSSLFIESDTVNSLGFRVSGVELS